MLTPKLQEALLAAFHAPGVTLNRCCAGYFDGSRGAQSPKVTVRTANALVDADLAVYNDPVIPSCLTLTPAGIEAGRSAERAAA